MPTPIICLDQPLRQFAAAFRPCFSKPQWQHFVTVLLALLLCREARTLTALYRAVRAPGSYAALTRFLASAAWQPQLLVAQWLARWARQLVPLVQAERTRCRQAAPPRRGRLPQAVVTGYLLGDDSTMHKPQGRKMEALGRHYSTTAGKPVPGHSLVAGLYLLLGRRVPLAPRLYRTQAAAAAEGVPFVDKLDLMVELITTFQPVAATASHVVLDSWYACARVWRAAKQRRFAITCGLKANRTIQIADATAPPGHRWEKLPEYAAHLTRTDYTAVARPGGAGTLIYVHLLPTRVRKLGRCRVAILRQSLDAPLTEARYWATSDLTGSAAAVLGHIAARWEIEVLFGDCKELLGLDQYQVMSSAAVLRWWTLVLLAYVLLEERRAAWQQTHGERLTLGQMQREIQRVHRCHLLGWLHEQFRRGATVEHIAEVLVV